MEFYYIIIIFIILLVIIVNNKESLTNAAIIIKRKKKDSKTIMKEALNKLLNKQVSIKTIADYQFNVKIIEVTDSALILKDKKDLTIIVNLEYIVSVDEIAEKK